MKRKQKSNYNFEESMKIETEAKNENQNFKSDYFFNNDKDTVSHTITNNPPVTKKYQIDTPFLDNFDNEFKEPDFKGTNKSNTDPFEQYSAKKEHANNPFDTFNTDDSCQKAPKSNDMLEQVLNHGFLSTKEPATQSFKTPFD